MRVLFTCVVGFGHFNPMVPLARAFVAAGHDVAVATDPAFCPTVEAMGFTAHPAGLDHEVARARFREAMPDWEVRPPGRPDAVPQPGHVRSDPRPADARRPGTDPRAVAARAADPRQRRDGRRGRGRGGRDRTRRTQRRPAAAGRDPAGSLRRRRAGQRGCRGPQPGRRRARRRDVSRRLPAPAPVRGDLVRPERPPSSTPGDRGAAGSRVRGVARRPGRSTARLPHVGHRVQRRGPPAVDRRRHRRTRRRHRGHARAGRRPVDRRRPVGARPRGVVHPAGRRSSGGAGS